MEENDNMDDEIEIGLAEILHGIHDDDRLVIIGARVTEANSNWIFYLNGGPFDGTVGVWFGEAEEDFDVTGDGDVMYHLAKENEELRIRSYDHVNA